MNNEFIPPDSTALFDVIITNESPYRETLNYALVLTSGNSYKGDFDGNTMDLLFNVNRAEFYPHSIAFPLHKLRSEDALGNLRNTRLSLDVSSINELEHAYSSIGLQVVSACEWELSLDWIYR